MKWNHHRGLFEFESSNRTLAAPAAVFGLTLDRRLTIGFAGEVTDDNPQPEEIWHETPLTSAEREEIAKEMVSRWLMWLTNDGFGGPCPNKTHHDGLKVPGLERALCMCASYDGGGLSPETARLLEQGMEDVLRGAISPIPVETTE